VPAPVRRALSTIEAVRWKQNLTPLEAVPELDESIRDKLVEHHITTAEELVGQIEAAPEGLGELLELDTPKVEELHKRAREVIDPEAAAAIEEQRGKEYPLGALPPDDELD
jgi:hypothetical protein